MTYRYERPDAAASPVGSVRIFHVRSQGASARKPRHHYWVTRDHYLIYDGSCTVCVRSAQLAQRWTNSSAEFIAYQDADLADLNLTSDQCANAIQWVESDRRSWSGGDAIIRMLTRSQMPWAFFGYVADRPRPTWMVNRMYRLLSRHRHSRPADPQHHADAPDKLAA